MGDDARLPTLATPDAELAEARFFLSGWTLTRYAERYRREQRATTTTTTTTTTPAERFERSTREGDGVTPPEPDVELDVELDVDVGGGAFGWTPAGPPTTPAQRGRARRPRARRRPRAKGVLTIPSCATVGQALRELAAADVLAAPAIDAATGDYAGWISCGGLVAQILRQLYPALTDPTLFAQDDVEAAVEDAADDQDANAMCFREAFDVAASRASAEARGLWSKLARVGDDGDTCYVGFADTTLLDFVSRGLDVRAADRKRIGDFEPCHRIGVFAEREDARAACEDQKNVKAGGVYAKAEGAAVGGGGDGDDDGDDDDDDDSLDITLADMRPKWIAVVAQLDVVDLMVANEDQLGTYPHATTMRTLGFANATVGDQTWGVSAVTSDFPVAGCLAIMRNAEVSGVAVLDEERRFLVGSLSASDVRRVVDADDLARALEETALEFLKTRVWSEARGKPPKKPPGADADAEEEEEEDAPGKVLKKRRSPRERGRMGTSVQEEEEEDGTSTDAARWRSRVVTATPDASLMSVMRKMSEARVHRVYIADTPYSPPRGVCTCTDVMRIFAVDPGSPEGSARLTW